MPKKPLTISEISQALLANGGFITQTARALNVSQPAISQRIKRSKILQEVLIAATEEHLDLAESMLVKAVKNGEAWAICFFLKCKGKERGYVEKVVHGTEDGKDMKISVTVENNEKD